MLPDLYPTGGLQVTSAGYQKPNVNLFYCNSNNNKKMIVTNKEQLLLITPLSYSTLYYNKPISKRQLDDCAEKKIEK